MAVGPVGAERDHYLWLDASQLLRDRLLRDRRRHRVDRTIRVAKHDDLAHAELACSGAELGLACLPDHGVDRPLRTGAEAAALSARRRDEKRLDAFRRVPGQRPARPQRFVVRVGEDAHQSPCHRTITVSRYSAGTTRPAAPPRSLARSSASISASSAAWPLASSARNALWTGP